MAYPSIYPTVLSVGATGFSDKRAYYSNYGEGIDIVAPGGDTSGTCRGVFIAFNSIGCSSHILTLFAANCTVDSNGDGYADGVLQETVEGGDMSY